jgi:hypothetical protein
MTPDTSVVSPQPDFVLGPLVLVAVAAFVRGVRRRKAAFVVLGLATIAVEFGSPAYGRFKRHPAALTLVAHYPDR